MGISARDRAWNTTLMPGPQALAAGGLGGDTGYFAPIGTVRQGGAMVRSAVNPATLPPIRPYPRFLARPCKTLRNLAKAVEEDTWTM
jgi:hypothetical protein